MSGWQFGNRKPEDIDRLHQIDELVYINWFANIAVGISVIYFYDILLGLGRRQDHDRYSF